MGKQLSQRLVQIIQLLGVGDQLRLLGGGLLGGLHRACQRIQILADAVGIFQQVLLDVGAQSIKALLRRLNSVRVFRGHFLHGGQGLIELHERIGLVLRGLEAASVDTLPTAAVVSVRLGSVFSCNSTAVALFSIHCALFRMPRLVLCQCAYRQECEHHHQRHCQRQYPFLRFCHFLNHPFVI